MSDMNKQFNIKIKSELLPISKKLTTHLESTKQKFGELEAKLKAFSNVGKPPSKLEKQQKSFTLLPV